jgi:hypothetical protein
MAYSCSVRDRHAFLGFLAASPSCAGFPSRSVDDLMAEPLAAQDPTALAQRNKVIIKSVKEVLNVMDFDRAARTKLSPAHYTFIIDGSFNNEALRANHEGFLKCQIRMGRLSGMSEIDQSVRIFGANWERSKEYRG